MVMKMRRYADGGKVELPPKETRVIKPTQLPPPKPGPKPKKIKRYADGGKVFSKPKTPKLKTHTGGRLPIGRDTVAAPDTKGVVDTLRSQRKRQEQMLGLKDGGKVKRR